MFAYLKNRIPRQIKGIFSDNPMQCHTLSYTLSYLLHYYIVQKCQRRLKLSKISAYIKMDKW